jgi:hypothetical protein
MALNPDLYSGKAAFNRLSRSTDFTYTSFIFKNLLNPAPYTTQFQLHINAMKPTLVKNIYEFTP